MRGAGSVIIGAVGMIYTAGLVLWLVTHFWWAGLVAAIVYLICRVARPSWAADPEEPNTSQAQYSNRR